MGMIKMAVRLFSMERNEPVDPAALLTAVNRSLPFVKEPNMYATAACITAGRNGCASFCTAGHSPILHYSGGTGEISRLFIEQFPVGLFSFEYAAQKSAFEVGDVFVICTDGILEAENANGEEFGASRVEQLLKENAREKPAQIFERIMAAVEQHCPRAADDRSLLILRKTYVQ